MFAWNLSLGEDFLHQVIQPVGREPTETCGYMYADLLPGVIAIAPVQARYPVN